VLADAAHTEALHALMTRYARGREDCSVTMALETLVVMRCFVRESGREGVQSLIGESTYFELDAAGVARHVDESELFHVGMWHGGELGPWGARQGSLTTYRALAPSVRADGALGRALAAAGVALAPVGFQPHVSVDVLEHGTLAAVVARAVARDAVPARLSVAGPDDAWLVADMPGEGPSATMADALPFTTVTVEPACATHEMTLRESAEPSSPVVAQLAAGTEVLVARGALGAQRSDLGEGQIAYVLREGDHGWASGDGLSPSYCVVTAVEPSER
jgi:hypothetical protein